MEYCPYCMRPASGTVCKSCGKPLAWTPWEGQLPAGTVLDGSGLHRYLTGAAIGQGGFGITYIAVEPDSGRRVAVKECFPVQCVARGRDGVSVEAKPGMTEQLQGALNSFLDEARLLAKQNELKSVVQVLDFFSTNGTAYLVMEYLDGVTLHDKVMREGKLPAQKLLGMLEPLMADIGRLHASGIIHRDISPDNIMWMPDDSLKLLDFGCARSMEDGKSMSVQLKHGFAPVEQYQTRGQGPWTDIYSLCATLYYCITGVMPTQAVERLEGEMLKPPTQLGAELTEKQEAALLWGLEVQPTKRPQYIELLSQQLYADYKPHREDKIKKHKSPPKLPMKYVGIASAALVLIIALIAIIAGGGDDTVPAWAPDSGGTLLTQAPEETSEPTVEPTPTPEPVAGEYESFEYLSYGDSIAISGYSGVAESALSIPEEIDGTPVTAVGDEAFRGQSYLGTIIIPDTVESIGELAFAGCTSMTMVFAGSDMDIGGGAFEGCDELRVLFKTTDFETDLSKWGFSANVREFTSGEDTGAGSLKMTYVTNDGVVYGVTTDDTAVVLDLPGGVSSIEIEDSLSDYPVVWLREDAAEGLDSSTQIYMGIDMGFPYELRNDFDWQFKDETGPGSFNFNWYMSCYLCERINEMRYKNLSSTDMAYIQPDMALLRATMERNAELMQAYGHDRPDGSEWYTVLDDFGVDYSYAQETIKKLTSVEELEGYIDDDCVELFYDFDDEFEELYTTVALSMNYPASSVSSLYMCAIGVIE